MRRNMTDVLDVFNAGGDFPGTTCSTRDGVVYSYAMPIAQRLPDGTVELLDRSASPSKTTSCHMGACYVRFPRATVVQTLTARP